MSYRFTAVIAFLLIVSFSAPVAAQEFTRGTRSAGMGEAFTSVATGPPGLYHNPAGIARAVMYAIEGGFEYAPTGNILNASISDSKTNPSLAAAAGYSFFFGRDDTDDITGHDIRLGVAVPVVPDRVSIGIGGRYIIMNDGDVELMNGFTLDAGTIFKVTDGLHLGIAGRNLIDQCSKTACANVAPTEIEGGVSFGSETGFLFSGDVGVDLTTSEDAALIAGAGAEYLIQGMVPVRLGYMYKGPFEDPNFLTAGLGWRSKAAGVDFGYKLNLDNTEDMHFLGSVSIYL